MKALTVREPWATAILDGRKRIENRTWTPSQLLVGERFAIHVGRTPDRTAIAYALAGAPDDRDAGLVAGSVVLAGLHRAEIDSPDALFGPCCSTPFAFYPEPGGRTLWHWELEEPRRFVTPFPAAGQLGLWEPDPSTAGRLLDAEILL